MTSPIFPTDPIPAKTTSVSIDPVVEPLIAKITAISQQLDELRNFIAIKTEDIAALYKAATLLTRKSTACVLAISESTVDRETRKGALQAICIDRRPRYSLLDLAEYVNARRSPRRKKASAPITATATAATANPKALGARNRKSKASLSKSKQKHE